MSMWLNSSGKRLLDSSGRVILCDECPCGGCRESLLVNFSGVDATAISGWTVNLDGTYAVPFAADFGTVCINQNSSGAYLYVPGLASGDSLTLDYLRLDIRYCPSNVVTQLQAFASQNISGSTNDRELFTFRASGGLNDCPTGIPYGVAEPNNPAAYTFVQQVSMGGYATVSLP